MQVGAAAAAAHLRNVFARAGVDSPPACLPAGSHNGSGCRGRPSGLGMHNNSARRCADRAVNRGRRSNVWGTGGRATASGQQSLSATAGFSQTRAPREQGPHELSGLQASMEVVQCGLRREGQRGASCNGRGHAGARCGAGAAPAFGKLVHAGGCGGGGGAFAQRVRPGRCRLTARVFARRFAQWQRVQRAAVRSGHA